MYEGSILYSSVYYSIAFNTVLITSINQKVTIINIAEYLSIIGNGF